MSKSILVDLTNINTIDDSIFKINEAMKTISEKSGKRMKLKFHNSEVFLVDADREPKGVCIDYVYYTFKTKIGYIEK